MFYGVAFPLSPHVPHGWHAKFYQAQATSWVCQSSGPATRKTACMLVILDTTLLESVFLFWWGISGTRVRGDNKLKRDIPRRSRCCCEKQVPPIDTALADDAVRSFRLHLVRYKTGSRLRNRICEPHWMHHSCTCACSSAATGCTVLRAPV